MRSADLRPAVSPSGALRYEREILMSFWPSTRWSSRVDSSKASIHAGWALERWRSLRVASIARSAQTCSRLPIVRSLLRRATKASISARVKRRWPPGVGATGISPAFAQRRRVVRWTPRSSAACRRGTEPLLDVERLEAARVLDTESMQNYALAL